MRFPDRFVKFPSNMPTGLFAKRTSAGMIFLLLSIAVPLMQRGQAQENRGSVLGTVTDQTGAPLPGATVQATDVATGVATTTTSSQSGDFNLPFLAPGDYRIEVDARGFAKATNPTVTVHAQQTQHLTFSLNVGSATQVVTVTSEAPLLETANTTTGQTISTVVVQNLPVNNENLLSETLLGPGMEPSQNGISGILQLTLTNGVTVTANGLRDSSNQYTIDGANMNIGIYNYPSYVPMPDAVQESNVVTGNYSAEYGQFAGAHVNYVLRSGTNQFHGNAWEYLENTDLNARNYFSTTVPTLRQNLFGGLFGGPIKRNSTFFMVAYEGLRNFTDSILSQNTITQAQRNGDLSSYSTPIKDPTTGQPFPGNQIPSQRISATAKAALGLDPAPNQDPTAHGGNNFGLLLATPRTDDEGVVKVDQSFGQHDQLTGRYIIRDLVINKLSSVVGNLDLINAPIQTRNLALIETHVLSPSAVVATRVAVNREHNKNLYPEVPAGTDMNKLFSMNNPYYVGSSSPFNIYPQFSIPGFTMIGLSGDAPLIQPDQNYEIASDVSVSRGRHALKMGFELDRYRTVRQVNDFTNGVLNFANSNPAGTGNALADFLLGLPSSTQVATLPVVVDLRRTATDLYITDQWLATQKLTVEMGLRYELDAPAKEHNGRISLFNFTAPGGFEQLAPGQQLWNNDLTDFAPRLGLDYRLTPNTVVRTFGGIFYSNPPTLALTTLPSNPPFITTYNFTAAAGNPLDASNPFPVGKAAVGGVPSPITVQQNRRTPTIYEWMLDIQHSLTPNLLIDVAYVGNRAIHLGREMGLNAPLTPGPGAIQARRPLPNFGPVTSIQYDALSTYHALQAKVEKHFTKGLSFLVSYTWSKNLDEASNENSGGTVIPTNLNFDYGPSDFDIPQNLTASYIYDLPFGQGREFMNRKGMMDEAFGGWQLSGVTTLRSGFPNTITYPGDVANVGLGTRPVRTCNGKLSNHTYKSWYNTACFQAPAQYTFGNSNRGIIQGPGYKDWDLALMKSFPTYHEQSLQFRFEFF
ncbi:MAG TPA: carboxypeptidase regulatory-like domain-containing protein, partial [Candidatus Angelobacter sp.]